MCTKGPRCPFAHTVDSPRPLLPAKNTGASPLVIPATTKDAVLKPNTTISPIIIPSSFQSVAASPNAPHQPQVTVPTTLKSAFGVAPSLPLPPPQVNISVPKTSILSQPTPLPATAQPSVTPATPLANQDRIDLVAMTGLKRTITASVQPTANNPKVFTERQSTGLGKRKLEDPEPKIVKLSRTGSAPVKVQPSSKPVHFEVKSFEQIIAEKRAREKATTQVATPQVPTLTIDRTMTASPQVGTVTATTTTPGQRAIRINKSPATTPSPERPSTTTTKSLPESPQKRPVAIVRSAPKVAVNSCAPFKTKELVFSPDDFEILNIPTSAEAAIACNPSLAHLFQDDELDKEFDNL
eukprot:c9265_g1_i1.p1 GENE.c9265_g1_i1~~c9265_g1_i1.p1  ORF type:complete len:353 (+),score=49.25 c9265_g1_i1:576-1634(+)